MKKAAFLLLFLCLSNSYALPLSAETENWCGKYFEQDGRGYIQLARNDFGIGSSDCSISGYSKRASESGTANIKLEFTRNRSTVGKWRKFHNHIIEVRGKFSNGSITGTRFIRDMGI